MNELIVGEMYYVSENTLEEAVNYRNTRYKYALCKCIGESGLFKIRNGVYRYMKYWVLEKEAMMEKRISDEKVANYLDTYKDPAHGGFQYQLMMDLQDARKELEEAKKDSVWRDAPDEATKASVLFCSDRGFIEGAIKEYKKLITKTPKQELIDKFAEKNALAMRCANLNKEILEAFVKEYEEIMKPLDK